MSYTLIIAQIKAILISATGVSENTVYDYVRWNEEADFIAAFQPTSTDIIHGYMITNVKEIEESEAPMNNTEVRTWRIYGYYSLAANGSTETTFRGIVENIKAKFRAKSRLNDTCLTSTPIQVDIFEPRMFTNTLCHYVEMRLETMEQNSYS